jgi:hypothetical protein
MYKHAPSHCPHCGRREQAQQSSKKKQSEPASHRSLTFSVPPLLAKARSAGSDPVSEVAPRSVHPPRDNFQVGCPHPREADSGGRNVLVFPLDTWPALW